MKIMKKVLFVLLMFLSTFSYSQQFDGVPISGSLSSVVNAYKAKGYFFYKSISATCRILKGKFWGSDVELYIHATPKSFKVYKISVFFEKQNSWLDIKTSFNRIFGIINNKYGEYDYINTYFDEPYYEDDGYEMSAVSLDKCHYSAFWMNRDNTSIGLYISKWKQIQLDYENDENTKLKELEVNLMAKNSF